MLRADQAAAARRKAEQALEERINQLAATPSGGSWGGISGTLSNQADLQTALNQKANSTSVLTQAQILARGLGC